jgi:hypothetical protein
MFKQADPVSLTAFLLIVTGILATLLATRGVKVFLGALAWLALLGAIVVSGALEAQPMPRVLIFLAASNLAGLAFGLSGQGRKIAETVPLAFLVAFQGFRLPLELVLHAWAEQGVIPTTMTWTGQNFDIATGILALIAAPLSTRFRAAAWVLNVVGFALLLNVMRVALLSSPLPFSWGVVPPLELAFHVPYFLIVPVCVAGALTGHVVLTRKLL